MSRALPFHHMIFFLNKDVSELAVQEGNQQCLQQQAEVEVSQSADEGTCEYLDKELRGDDYLGVAGHLSRGDVLKGEGFTEYPIAE